MERLEEALSKEKINYEAEGMEKPQGLTEQQDTSPDVLSSSYRLSPTKTNQSKNSNQKADSSNTNSVKKGRLTSSKVDPSQRRLFWKTNLKVQLLLLT